MTLTIGEPILPDMSLSERERRQQLRDAVYAEMKRVSDAAEQYEHILYVKKDEENGAAADVD